MASVNALPEWPALADEVILADEFVERPRSHPFGEWRRCGLGRFR